MPRLLLLILLGLLLVSHIDAQKSKRKSKKFKALLPVFEPPKPKTNTIVEKPIKTGTAASSSSTIEAVGTIEIGKEKAPQPSSPSKKVLPPEPLKPVQEQNTVIQSPPANKKNQVAKKNVQASPYSLFPQGKPQKKQANTLVQQYRPPTTPTPANKKNQVAKKDVQASPYSLFPQGKPQKKQANTLVQQYRPPTAAFSMKKTKQSTKSAPSKPRLGNANFFGFQPMSSSTPAPTTPAPPTPVQQSLFNFFNGQNGPSPTQQSLPFPLPSMPPYPGLPNNNPQLKNVYRMIATWLVSHAMHGTNNAAPHTSRPITTATKQIPPPPPSPQIRLPNTQRQQQQQKQQQQRRRNNLLTPPPQRKRKQKKVPKHSQKKQKTQRNKKQEDILRKMREKAYREYMDEVFDVDVPDTAFANGRIPSFQAPSFEFPW